jgi:hypothetical protein
MNRLWIRVGEVMVRVLEFGGVNLLTKMAARTMTGILMLRAAVGWERVVGVVEWAC